MNKEAAFNQSHILQKSSENGNIPVRKIVSEMNRLELEFHEVDIDGVKYILKKAG